MNSTAANRIDARRPIWSPSQPQVNDPITVPVIPNSGNRAAGVLPPGFRADFKPYSVVMPGRTKPSVVGFMTSIVTAAAMTSSRPMWAGRIGASSRAPTRI